jgi:hypothetical protein
MGADDETTISATESISHTRKTAFRACRRRHHYAHVIGVVPVRKALQLTVGHALHVWCELWATYGWVCPSPELWDAGDDMNIVDEVTAPLGKAFLALQAEDPYEAARLRAMVLAYHIRWHQQGLQSLAVEAEFRAPLINPLDGQVSRRYYRRGFIDWMVALGEAAGPEWEGQWVMEHKSHKGPLDPGDMYLLKLRMDPQCSDYMIGAEALGFEPRGIIYDVVCKPAIEPHTATPLEKRKMTIGMGCKTCHGGKGVRGQGTDPADIVVDVEDRRPCVHCDGTGWKDAPRFHAHVRLEDETPGEYGMRCFEIILAEPERYLVRHKVVRLSNELRDHEIDDWYTVRAMHEQRQAAHVPHNPDACFLYNMPCDYWPVCTGAASLDDPKLYRINRRPTVTRAVTE